MNVNRNNYEEFFLLYVDDELSMAERKAIESFVRENPDLGEELHMLKQTKLRPDQQIYFENKQSLLRVPQNQLEIGQDNYETYFLLYVDRELDEAGKKAVEIFAAQHKTLQQELDLLLQTRLGPGPEIVFGQKELLYKREEGKRIGFIPWFRIAAAAIVLLLSGGLVFFNRSTTGNPSTIAENTHGIPEKMGDPKKNESSTVTPASVLPLHRTEDKSGKDMMDQQRGTRTYPYAKNERVGKKASANGVKGSRTNLPVNAQIGETNQVTLRGIVIMKEQPGQSIHPGKMEPVRHSLVAGNPDPGASDVAVGGNEVNPFAKQASINELLPDNEDGIKIMTFSTKKNTMRGLFRKVSRVFEKTTNADDENKRGILIGSFQVPLK
jgi:hypothetical protein